MVCAPSADHADQRTFDIVFQTERLSLVVMQFVRSGRLAQLVEHLVYTERVSGSSPLPPTIATPSSPSRHLASITNWRGSSAAECGGEGYCRIQPQGLHLDRATLLWNADRLSLGSAAPKRCGNELDKDLQPARQIAAAGIDCVESDIVAGERGEHFDQSA